MHLREVQLRFQLVKGVIADLSLCTHAHEHRALRLDDPYAQRVVGSSAAVRFSIRIVELRAILLAQSR